MKLMVLDPDNNNLPEPNPELLLIPCFFKLWTREWRIDGDRDGKKKTRNKAEFGYIYFTNHYDTRFKMLDETQKEERIRELLKLPPNWEPDDVLDECISEYIDTQYSPTLELVETFNGLNKDLALWVKAKRLTIKNGTASPKDVSEILDIGDRLQTTVETIRRAKDTLMKEQDAIIGKKGRSIGKFELDGAITKAAG